MTRLSIQIPRRPFSMDSPTTTVINAWNFRSVTPGDEELHLGEYLLSRSCKPSPSYFSPDSSWSEDDTIAANNIFVLTSAESSPICASPAPSPPSPPAPVPVARTIIFDDIPPIPSIETAAVPAPSVGSPPTRRRPVWAEASARTRDGDDEGTSVDLVHQQEEALPDQGEGKPASFTSSSADGLGDSRHSFPPMATLNECAAFFRHALSAVMVR
mmetsp:Transcript_28418/g.57713  ORF Transcript_28418/g.57713 Transcript_28418/m.57713 type:complete len:214 (-) Transcript_28418:568-1209(-)